MMIYMLKGAPFNGDYLDGYVTDVADVHKIAENHYCKNIGDPDETYLVLIYEDKIVVTANDGFDHTFYIVTVMEI